MKPNRTGNAYTILAMALWEVVQFTFTDNKWNSYFANNHAGVYKNNVWTNNLFSLTFPDLHKNYRKFPDYSRFSPEWRQEFSDGG